MTQAQTDEMTSRLDEQHDALLQRLDELDAKIAAVLDEWTGVVEQPVSPKSKRYTTDH